MGSGKGGSSSDAGIYAAIASADAADKAYKLGEEQFQWSKDVWTQEQPLLDQSTKAQMDLATQETAAIKQTAAETAQQWQMYLDTYAPLEKSFVAQAENWASPQNLALVRGQAMGAVAEEGQQAINAAAQTLRGYGINPGSQRYASLYASAQPMLGAAEAAAGTTAAQNLRLQQMALEGQAINTGRGLVNATTGLTSAGAQATGASAGAASGAGQTATSNIGSTAVGAGATSNLFNAGTNAMNSYVNAVNGYNQTQADFATANANEVAGLGSAVGSIAGLGYLMKSDVRDKTDIKREGTSHDGVPLYSFRYKEDPKTYPKVVGPMAQDIAKLAPHRVGAIPGSPKGTLAIGFADGGDVTPTNPQLNPWSAPRPLPQSLTTLAPDQRTLAPYPTTGEQPPYQQSGVVPYPTVGAPQHPAIQANPPSNSGIIDYYTRAVQPGPVVTYPSGEQQQIPINTYRQPQSITPQQRAVANARGVDSRIPLMAERGGGREAALLRAGGGPIGYQDGGDVGVTPGVPPAVAMEENVEQTPAVGGGETGRPGQPVPPGGTPGGGVPPTASPSMGQTTDDVPAMLTADEFVIPKDVATWKGHEYFVKQIDAARVQAQKFQQRGDIGGEPTEQPQPQSPTFVSRPLPMPGGQTPWGQQEAQLPQQAVASQFGGAIPGRPV